MKFEIFKYGKVTSTNDVAIKLIKEKNREIGCIYAETQTKGRGTKGRKWISKKGNLFGSIFFPLKKNYPPFNEFCIINPVLISEVIQNFCKKRNITYKWPNDVYVNGRKICGILQELITFNKQKFLIIGIGINVTSNPKINIRFEATNILRESNKRTSAMQIINKIIFSYEEFFFNLNSYSYKIFKKKVNLLVTN